MKKRAPWLSRSEFLKTERSMMAKLSKKTIRQINQTSVFAEILRERFESSLTGFFLDSAPDMWNDEQRVAFDMVARVEDELKAAILKVLGYDADTQDADTSTPKQESGL